MNRPSGDQAFKRMGLQVLDLQVVRVFRPLGLVVVIPSDVHASSR